MTISKSAVCALLCMAALCALQAQAPEEKTSDAETRIGVYDSRAIAVAYAGTEVFKNWLQDLKERHKEAEAAGDTVLAAKCEKEAQARQAQLHRQGFSTAPVDDMLEHIKDDLPGIMKEARISAIVSKWDEAKLAEYGSAERVDITMDLVMALKPSEQQLEIAKRIQEKPPIPLEKLEKEMAEGGH